MESAEKLQKNIGIMLGCIVIFVVVGVTFFNESGPDIASTTPISATSSPTTSNTVAQNPPASVPVSNRSDDSDGSDEGSEGSRAVSKTASSPRPASTPVIPAATPAIAPKKTASVYTNGTYTATGSYMSPSGEDTISVTLTLANDIITSISVTPGVGGRTSQKYQNDFISGYKQYVIGQNITSVNLTRVSGSSLTPIGFNDALAQIKAQAKA
jgi:hypothetical protein